MRKNISIHHKPRKWRREKEKKTSHNCYKTGRWNDRGPLLSSSIITQRVKRKGVFQSWPWLEPSDLLSFTGVLWGFVSGKKKKKKKKSRFFSSASFFVHVASVSMTTDRALLIAAGKCLLSSHILFFSTFRRFHERRKYLRNRRLFNVSMHVLIGSVYQSHILSNIAWTLKILHLRRCLSSCFWLTDGWLTAKVPVVTWALSDCLHGLEE